MKSLLEAPLTSVLKVSYTSVTRGDVCNCARRTGAGLTSNLGSYFTPSAVKSTQSSLSGLLDGYLATAPGTKSSDPQCAPTCSVT